MKKRSIVASLFAAAALNACDSKPAPVPPAPATSTPVAAPPAPLAPPAWENDSRFAEVVIDANTGAVLYGAHETAPRHIASLTKIMTAYMVFSALSDGRLAADTALPVSAHAAGQGGTGLDLATGTTITVDEALHALITISANDAAVVLAEALAGSEAEFARQMTSEATRIGTLSTTFRTASGLTQPGQISSARDIAVIFARLQRDYPQFFDTYFSTPYAVIQGETMRNCTLCYQPDTRIVGHKGGFTNAAGRSLAIVTRSGGQTRVMVTLGAPSNEDRTARAEQLARHYRSPAA